VPTWRVEIAAEPAVDDLERFFEGWRLALARDDEVSLIEASSEPEERYVRATLAVDAPTEGRAEYVAANAHARAGSEAGSGRGLSLRVEAEPL
jgi:hypothetical protein